jgi:hypothetical protein
LTVFAESLNKARVMIYPPTKKSSKLGEILPGLGEIVDKEHKRLLARKSIIEKRKEEQERQLLEMAGHLNYCLSIAYRLIVYYGSLSSYINFCLLGTRGGVKEAEAAEDYRRGRAEEACNRV